MKWYHLAQERGGTPGSVGLGLPDTAGSEKAGEEEKVQNFS
jgi:hypothetical protein